VFTHYFYVKLRLNKDMEKQTKKSNYTYKPQYGIVVICRDETHQIQLYNQLKERSLELKIVVV